MSKLSRKGLIALLAILLHSLHAGSIVEGSCGHCYGSHACMSNSTFQICFNGVPSSQHAMTCPDDKLICTQYGTICMANIDGLKPACGDTSTCDMCGNGEVFACTSTTSFGVCSGGVLAGPQRISCQENYFCSVTGAATGNPCKLACEPDPLDICDRDDNLTPDTTTPEPTTVTAPITNTPTIITTPETTTPETTTPITTTPVTTTPIPTLDADAVCQSLQRTGRFPIPNDTVCTSFIYCHFKANSWRGDVTNCLADKPYFIAGAACGTVRPTGPGCV